MDRLTAFRPQAHALFRIIFGFAFFTHGGQKLFAWFGGRGVPSLMSEFGAAGVLEFSLGLLILIGLWTHWAAFIASGEMAVAYFWKHAMTADGFELFHWANRGEMVMLFCFAFLFLATIGSGSYSMDAMLGKRKGAGA
jgi:putative oxidoreductase